MKYFWMSLIGFFAALVGSMGLGGGGVLLLYLSAFTSATQLAAQGINLIFFLPIGLTSVLTHIKNGLIRKKTAALMILGALPTAALGAWGSAFVSQDILRKILAIFLMILGARELINSFRNKEKRT